MEKPKVATTPWDAADYIETPEDVVEFLEAALEGNDARLQAEAIEVVSRARGTAALAQRAGIPLDTLLQGATANGSDVATLFGIMQAMGLHLDVRAKQVAAEPA